MTSIEKNTLATVLAVTAALLSGCGRHEGVRVCADHSGHRLDDADCYSGGGAHGSAGWLYVRSGNAPAIGGAVIGGANEPEAGGLYGMAPREGISRGGFGGIGEGFGGGEGGGGRGGGGGE